MVLWEENTMDVYVDQTWKFVGSTMNMTEDEIKLRGSSTQALCHRSSHTLLNIVLDVAQVSNSILAYSSQL
jgi:hypothetical protein